ncbi:MAG: flavodoxin-dependent (E)-4-hydroxy-3-methylbut-2-enyl-diphosphate synthase [Thermoguttaceae bacterium]|nr:flavodoxin-dependent (E)-4-hydroxy-3-methylbut-2-enyl-diphosphate synthase [Thermoguttaceae bacterium]MDW8038173.1 flavodoxin/ferredoxin-dependent (E)-4-hydroxy-3-methylbut-2-enyl-diphosphate synthase [Thermoguttaceae bacterium]
MGFRAPLEPGSGKGVDAPVRKPTRPVRVGSLWIGGGHPIVVQSMCATRTSDVSATVAQIHQLAKAGAGIVRLAVDNRQEVQALVQIRQQVDANLAVDLQENYRLAAEVAPWVQKIRYNPGHLHHQEPRRPWEDKVRWLAEVAAQHDCAVRIGVNCGSVDPVIKARFPPEDALGPMLASALEHCELLDRLGFTRYCVSLKDSDPRKVVEANRRFALQRPEVPLHLGVTEAGLPPEGIRKTRWALQTLLAEGIGDTIRVSLTVPAEKKYLEVEAGLAILADLAAGRLEPPPWQTDRKLNIVSCPSCSRVENEMFVQLAEKVRQLAEPFQQLPITIAVMGCRVNGPGETDTADLGLWCGPSRVNLKRGSQLVGSFSYEEILTRLELELRQLWSQHRQ